MTYQLMNGLEIPLLYQGLSFAIQADELVQLLNITSTHWVKISNISYQGDQIFLCDNLNVISPGESWGLNAIGFESSLRFVQVRTQSIWCMMGKRCTTIESIVFGDWTWRSMRNVAVQLDHHEPYLRFYYRKREKIKQYEFFLEKLKKKKGLYRSYCHLQFFQKYLDIDFLQQRQNLPLWKTFMISVNWLIFMLKNIWGWLNTIEYSKRNFQWLR